MSDDLTDFQQGADDATGGGDPAARAERACVRQWLERIKQARDFDKEARKQYARDRKYARGDDGKFEVSVPIAPAYIDVLNSFLFARQPDVSVEPSAATQPPPERDLQAKARQDVQAAQAQQGQQIAAQAVPVIQQAAASGALPALAQQVPQVMQALQQQMPDPEDAAQQQAQQLGAPYQQRRTDAKQFAQTLEIVIAGLWQQAKLKKQGKPLVRSALSVGVGWLKASWQERTGDSDPVLRNQFNDVQDNIRRLQALRAEISDGQVQDTDAKVAELQQTLQGLQAKVEQVIARGFAIDFVPAEDIQVATSVASLTDYAQAPWIAHRTFMPVDEARASLPRIRDDIGRAQVYYARKPQDANTTNDVGQQAQVDAKDADAYTTGEDHGSDDKGNVCLWEVWDKDTNTVVTVVEGVDRYAKDTYTPDPGTTRFYPFFLYAIGVVDGERHPRSLITRSAKLLDEYNRARSNWRTARTRAIPKTAFNATLLPAEEAQRLTGAGTQEMVPIALTDPEKKLSDALEEVTYAKIDPALYDTAPIRAEIETNWGVQEALSSSIHTAKTATEAEIQQTGTNSRTGFMRDDLDDMLGDLAQYTAEVAVQKLTPDDAVRMAGPWAFWPENMTVEDLSMLVEVDIRAGSTGKPNTSQKQQVWATVYPLLNASIDQIGALRSASPDDIAKCKAELMSETLARTGDRIDAERFLPEAQQRPNRLPPGPPPNPADLSLQGQQIDAMTKVCDQVRTNVISPQTAMAILHIGFPAAPPGLIEQMVAGVAKIAPALPPDHKPLLPSNGATPPAGMTPPTDTMQ